MPEGPSDRTIQLEISSSQVLSFICTLIFLLQVIPFAVAAERNVTIDDQLGDQDTGERPRYIPSSEWQTQACTGCSIIPDVTQLFRGTAMQTTLRVERNNTFNSIDFTFNGTAIYIFFTLYNWETADSVTTSTECNFAIDGGSPTFFRHVGDMTLHNVRQYQSLVFHRTGLPQQPHHMNISASGDHNVFTSFDYAIYTVEIPDAIRINSTTDSSSFDTIPPSSTSIISESASNANTPQQSTTESASNLSRTMYMSSSTSSSPTSVTPSLNASTLPATRSSNISPPAPIDPSYTSHANQSPEISPGVIARCIIGGLTALIGFIILFYYCAKKKKNPLRQLTPRPFYAQHFRSSRSQNTSGGHTIASKLPIPSQTGIVSRTAEHTRIQGANKTRSRLRRVFGGTGFRETDTTEVPSGYNNPGSSAVRELMMEVRELRNEVRIMRRPPQDDPPPTYTD